MATLRYVGAVAKAVQSCVMKGTWNSLIFHATAWYEVVCVNLVMPFELLRVFNADLPAYYAIMKTIIMFIVMLITHSLLINPPTK